MIAFGCDMKFDDLTISAIHPLGTNSPVSQDNNSLKKIFTPAYMLRALLFFVASYIIFWGATHFLWLLLIEMAGIKITSLDARYWPEFIIAFVLFFLPLLYFFPSFVAQKFLSVNFPRLVLFMGCTFFGAMWCEILLDTLFVKFIGQPGWIYKIWPIHHGYTSGVGMFMWPLYGFFIYFLNNAIETSPRLVAINNGAAKVFLFTIDAMVLEILANTFSILMYHTYLFYYLPNDLLHFTTIQIFIPYLLVSSLGTTLLLLLDRFKKNHFAIGLSFYLAGVVSVLWIA